MIKNKILRTHLFQILKGENADFLFYIELSEMGENLIHVNTVNFYDFYLYNFRVVYTTRRVSLVEQEPLTFQGHLSSIFTPGFNRIRVVQHFCVVFCK